MTTMYALPRRRIAAFLLIILLTAGCREEVSPPFDQQLYVWQRQWLPAHAEALVRSYPDFSTLRVLALQAHPDAGWSRVRVDRALLRRDGRPLVAVVRLDGRLAQQDALRARKEITALLAEWKAADLEPQALEIDHDCASARLPDYARFLGELRQALPAGLSLGITALPTWLSSPELDRLLAKVDGSVLQVHGVSAPEQGLFDAGKAFDWAQRWNERSDRPFFLALPAYGTSLIDSPAGTRVESEAPLGLAGERRELSADPRQVAGLLEKLRRDRPPHLAGLIWFRLPLTGDRRAWPYATLRAVARGERLAADLQVSVGRPDGGTLHEFTLSNSGNVAIPLPSRVDIAARDCQAFDALPGYRMQRSDTGLALERQAIAGLAAGQRRALGWARCSELDQGGIHVRP